MASYHTRSISLPSTFVPATFQFEEQLASTSSSSSLTHKLTGLSGLYELVDEMLQLPSNKQSVSQIQAVLDGSLRLVDICTTTRDVLLQSKEQIQQIQSVLRRRCSGELNITSEVSEYLKSRKSVKKTIKACLKNIKCDEGNVSSKFFLNDVEEITMDVFASLLFYIGGTKSQSRSVFAKLIHKKESSVGKSDNEFDAVDASFESVVCHKNAGVETENIRNQTVKLESEIEELDQGLERLFRHLVRNRATLLNILSN